MNYKTATEYTGTYRGISWSIRKSEGYGHKKEAWCHYIYLNMNQIPAERHDDFWLKGKMEKFSEHGRPHLMYPYMQSIINDLDWHCGCTYYDKVGGFDGGDEVIKMGCDYQHFYDEGQDYNLQYVLGEVQQTIDSLHNLIPVKVFCRWGACKEIWHLEENGQYCSENKEGFLCNHCLEVRAKELEKVKRLKESN